MIYHCVHTDLQLGFSVYRGNRWDDLILVATLPGAGRGEIAMRLTDPEPIMFTHYTDCFPELVEDVVASRESPKYKSRMVSIRRLNSDSIECLTEPDAAVNGGPGATSRNSEAGEGPPSVSS